MSMKGTKNVVDQRVQATDRCTAIAVGGGASTTGSPMTTHTADCMECDWRINKVPARDWPEGTMRPVYALSGSYPRQVRDDRGFTWSKANLENLPQRGEWEKQNIVIGYIPQVAHTYALIEGMYGIMNEWGVSIGESSCVGKLYAAPVNAGGKALLEVSELSQLALERTKSAREAIVTMGELAEQYGYYSAEWDTTRWGPTYPMSEGGEALTVTDADEAWVFHILPDDKGTGAVWVAQRVPDDHIAAVANFFVIREVVPDHPDFMYSNNLWTIAEQKGWWKKEDGNLNFMKVYSPQVYHPSGVHRRVWRVLSLGAPDLNLPGETNGYADDYPFSVKVTRPQGAFSPVDIMWMQRDHFEGTPYSTAVGIQAGPFGDPNRWDFGQNGNLTVMEEIEGEFERTISLFRTSYSFVTEPRKNVPNMLNRLWFGLYAPDSSSYTPIYVNSEKLSEGWTSGTMQQYNPKSAWWNFCVVGNYAGRFYMFAMEPVRQLQHRLESELLLSANAFEASLRPLFKDVEKNRQAIVSKITDFTVQKGDYVSKEWENLFPVLLASYRDGYKVSGFHNATIEIKRLFYPRWWLETTGFFDHPGNKEGILFAPNTNRIFSSDSSFNPFNEQMIIAFFSGFLFFVFGMWFANKKTGNHNKKSMNSKPEFSVMREVTGKQNVAGEERESLMSYQAQI
jgi:dipeptidase